MMDERTCYLLKIINEKCSEGSYKVLSIDELIDEFPKVYKADNDLIKQMITALTSEMYISLKFDKDDEFCVSPTPKGREFFENRLKVQNESLPPKRDYLHYLYLFLIVFLGSFFSGFLLKILGGIC